MKINNQIRGDLAVCCGATVAGRFTAGSSATVKGNLRVEGWLDAKNLRTPCKGLFADYDSLLRAYPEPMPGWWALVGTTIPAQIYVGWGRRWTDTGETGGEIVVDLDAYDTAIENINERVDELGVEIMNVEHPIQVADTAAADLIIADENANPIATFAGGHIRTANFDSANIGSAGSAAAGDHPVEVSDIAGADLVLADENANPIATFAGGHIITANFNSADIQSGGSSASADRLSLPGKWCALGTSITAFDDIRTDGIKGYQYWVRRRINFAGGYVNKGVNSYRISSLAANLQLIVPADYYTLEFGTNDFLGTAPPGTIDDYVNATGADTFYGAMRVVIDKIYQVNPAALIILCTPRKCYYAEFNVGRWDAPNPRGTMLIEFVNAVKEIALYESLPVADFFALTNANGHNLPSVSVDTALHPNELGYKMMANVLFEQFRLLHQY